MNLTNDELRLASKIRQLKANAGTHSPSIQTIVNELPELNIDVDACFLSNPYATELFLEYIDKELIATNKLRDVLEFYPSQNVVLADVVGKSIDVDPRNIFIGNGAIEIIQVVLHNFVEKKIIVNIPTFSSYYEFARPDTEVVFYKLDKDKNFVLNPDHYIEFVKENSPDTIILINPNNPDGGYTKYKDLRYIIQELQEVKNIIIDESFIHFAFEDEELKLLSATELFKEFNNVIVIKSMSKDFGIAGIRAGYGLLPEHKVSELLSNGYLWNSNGLAEYFFRLYNNQEFFEKYEKVRKKYIAEAQEFFTELSTIPGIKVYPSMANFALIELEDVTSADFVSKLLIKYGIYTRTGSDKIGLVGEFIRIAGRTREENIKIIAAIRNAFAE